MRAILLAIVLVVGFTCAGCEKKEPVKTKPVETSPEKGGKKVGETTPPAKTEGAEAGEEATGTGG